MKRMIFASSLALILLLAPAPAAGFTPPWPPPAPADSVVGTWLGTLTVPGGQLRIVFHVTRDSTGALTATLDSPDQGVAGIPVNAVVVSNDSLRLDVQAVLGSYEGKIGADGSTIDGTWRQGGLALPLKLARTDEDVAPPPRPQEPKPPYPYAEEDVGFDHPEDGIRLAGTLTLPRSEGPHPAVVLISGSGPQDRNETVFNHRPFLVLADYLTRRGLAVLRFDDRGVGASTGDFSTATSEDFAGDVRAGIAYLKTRPDIDPAKIGLVGHSEGGLVAPMVAAEAPGEVAFIVLLAGTALTGEEILYLQGELIARANGASDEAIALNRSTQARLFEVLKHEPDSTAAAAQMRAALLDALDAVSDEEKEALGFAGADEDELIDGQIRQLLTPWFRYFVRYDPRPTLRKVQCPVLAVIGEKDLQVPPTENLREIEAALQAGGNTDYRVVELPGLNHLFQTAGTGAPAEYARIEETIAPSALQLLGDWIVEQTR